MKIYQPLLFSFLVLFLLSFPKTTSAENRSGTGNCWDDFYDPPATTTQVVRIDVLGIELTIPSNYKIPLNRKWEGSILLEVKKLEIGLLWQIMVFNPKAVFVINNLIKFRVNYKFLFKNK